MSALPVTSDRRIWIVERRTVPNTNAAVIRELGATDILDAGTAARMAEAAGFRNVLSHRYGDAIDDEDVYNFLTGSYRCSTRISAKRAHSGGVRRGSPRCTAAYLYIGQNV